jgi:hypothetical protein
VPANLPRQRVVNGARARSISYISNRSRRGRDRYDRLLLASSRISSLSAEAIIALSTMLPVTNPHHEKLQVPGTAVLSDNGQFMGAGFSSPDSAHVWVIAAPFGE